MSPSSAVYNIYILYLNIDDFLFLGSKDNHDENTTSMVDTLYIRDLLETYSMKSDLIIVWVYFIRSAGRYNILSIRVSKKEKKLYAFFLKMFYRSTSRITEELDKSHMCWMEIVTRGLPPCIMIQGNTIQTVTASA